MPSSTVYAVLPVAWTPDRDTRAAGRCPPDPRCPVRGCPVRWRSGDDRPCADHIRRDVPPRRMMRWELQLDRALLIGLPAVAVTLEGRVVHPRPNAAGERHHLAKLTDADAAAIQQRYAAGGISQPALAREYGVTQMTVWRVIHGQRFVPSATED